MGTGSVFVVSDATVHGLYGEALIAALAEAGHECVSLVMAAGESSKRRDVVADMQDMAIAAGIDRDSRVVALGGGVPGDLGGYMAATLLRGVPWLQLPTTLLAMVDSSVGGKTGVDTAAGKNLIGAFWHPRVVLADVDTLATLPDEELAAGLAEVIKYGATLEEQLFSDLEDGLLESCMARVPEAVALVVERCVSIKADVVAEDARELNRRQVLNFGHTIGHGIEVAMDYTLRHGEAVAIGMVAEARLSEGHLGAAPDLAERVAALCVRAGLPVRLPDGAERRRRGRRSTTRQEESRRPAALRDGPGNRTRPRRTRATGRTRSQREIFSAYSASEFRDTRPGVASFPPASLRPATRTRARCARGPSARWT